MFMRGIVAKGGSHVAPGGRLVAICSEGPFFRQDAAAVSFRGWLDAIGATVEKLPPDTFRESGTGVAARLIVAAPGEAWCRQRALEDEAVETVTAEVRDIPMRLIDPDPNQPRKTFGRDALSELAASIRPEGLIQPITVRSGELGRFVIVTGERRWRAQTINGAATIRAIVDDAPDEAGIAVRQIVENDQRADVPPLEQARSYQALMDKMGWTAAELGARIGKAPHRITERTDLLRLQPEYQGLLGSGNLRPSEAYEMSGLAPRGQGVLFNAIRSGAAKNYGDLRATANALVQAEAQTTFALDIPPGPTDEERHLASSFEAQVARIGLMLRSGISDNQVVAVKKVDPFRAAVVADQFAQMQKDLRRIEVALREAAIQAQFLAA